MDEIRKLWYLGAIALKHQNQLKQELKTVSGWVTILHDNRKHTFKLIEPDWMKLNIYKVGIGKTEHIKQKMLYTYNTLYAVAKPQQSDERQMNRPKKRMK